MASNYTVDELDRITATLEHLQDAMQVYFDHQADWTPDKMNRLLTGVRNAEAQLEVIQMDYARRLRLAFQPKAH